MNPRDITQSLGRRSAPPGGGATGLLPVPLPTFSPPKFELPGGAK